MAKTDKVQEIYALVPDVECKGLCVQACGPILMSRIEQQIIESEYGTLPEPSGPRLTCSKLVDGRCSIYQNRPLVCRLFGAVGGMPCPYGCKPKGGRMSDMIARRLIRRMAEL